MFVGELAVRYAHINRLLTSAEDLECLDTLVSCENRSIEVYSGNFRQPVVLKTLLEIRHLFLGDLARGLPVGKEVIDLSFFVMPL